MWIAFSVQVVLMSLFILIIVKDVTESKKTKEEIIKDFERFMKQSR